MGFIGFRWDYGVGFREWVRGLGFGDLGSKFTIS